MGACTGNQKQRYDPSKDLVNYKVIINAFIWNKNTHNLFDFENNDTTKRQIVVDFSANIAIVDNYIVALTKKVVFNNIESIVNQQILFHLNCNPEEVALEPISSSQDHRIWAIIRNNFHGSLTHWDIQQNDMIKLGRVRIHFTRIMIVDQPVVEEVPDEEESESMGMDDDDGDGLQCKICFSQQATITNPLMRPCQCTGSVKYIHLKCLQSWIGMQVKVKVIELCTIYIWKNMECEICKAPFKWTYTFRNREYQLLKIIPPNKPYIMMSIQNDEKQKEGMIFMLELGNRRELRIGRIPECEIKLMDISVSRQHAVLRIITDDINNPILRLNDNGSKFGTLLLAQSDKLKNYKPLNTSVLYQVGRVLLNMSVQLKKDKYNNKIIIIILPPQRASQYKHPNHLVNVPNENFDEIHLTNNELNVSDIIISNKQILKNMDDDNNISDEQK